MCYRSFILLFFALFTGVSVFSQSIRQELKADLWKTIRPEGKRDSLPMDSVRIMKPLPSKIISIVPPIRLHKHDLLPMEDIKNRPADTIKIDPHVFTFSKMDLKKVDANSGMSSSQFNGLIVNCSKSSGSGGFSLGILERVPKKLSKKTKRILKEVYGVSDEELKGK